MPRSKELKEDHPRLPVRLEPALKAELDAVLTRKKVSQQTAVTELIRWWIAQDDLLQSAIIGQVTLEPPDDITTLIVKRMTQPARKPKVSR